MKSTHIAGTFLIDADGSFLNGAGLGEGEDRNVTIVKTMREGKFRIPYVSAQSWKRWLRNTAVEENGWNPSVLRAIDFNDKGNTNKIAGELNPVEFPEDDLFGYMETKGKDSKNDGDSEEESEEAPKSKSKEKVKPLVRASPFVASILKGVRKSGNLTKDEGFVHLKEGTPQPYTTQFYSTAMQGVFCLDYNRIGVFDNRGDRIELDGNKAENFMKKGLIEEAVVEDDKKGWKVYKLKDLENKKNQRAAGLLKSLAVLRGGAKQAAFGTDVTPKFIILAAIDCGIPIFNRLFTQEEDLVINVESLKQVLSDYKDRIEGHVYIGYRKGFISNEAEIDELKTDENLKKLISISSPIEAVAAFNKELLNQ
ncbi:MAG: type I-B CRISPR-associated protein Cas7/Cst2/DevR [Methanosarcinales archaeon]|jgi:CRISPR-associated protein Cst2|nr:type I-B CRISPR-associated protein Cas7/Cst2/DevR [Methanosarcinales archaeon]